MKPSPRTSEKRFATFDGQQFDAILQNKDAQNTKKATKQATKQAVTIFKEYLMKNGLDVDIQTADRKTLASIFAKFYVEVRRADEILRLRFCSRCLIWIIITILTVFFRGIRHILPSLDPYCPRLRLGQYESSSGNICRIPLKASQYCIIIPSPCCTLSYLED